MAGPLRRRRWWILLACAYVALLVASRIAEPPYDREPGPDLEVTELDAVDGDRLEPPRPVRFAWRAHTPERAATDGAGHLPVVLLHGSPGSHDDFDRLAPPLAARGFTLYAFDLPGFGASSRRVPDYSTRAHARYVLDWLDRRGIERAHLLGFSMGGGVALELYRMAPERVASVTLLSSIGVQEMELLGDYSLNHLLHGLQLGGLWILHRAVPHFGALTHFPLDVPYARNFYDTDQRPLRAVLSEIEPPVLILHGREDFLVPQQAAVEHHRLVPQSELVMLETSHFFVFRGEPDTTPTLASFWTRVESGEATTRATAAADRVRLASAPFDRKTLPRWMGPALLAVGAALALLTFASEDLTSIAAGFLVADGRMPFAAAALACSLGIFIGDLLLFGVGRWIGRPMLRRAPLRWWIDEDALARSSAWFERRGAVVILISRFTPGTRLVTYLSAGLLHTSFWRYSFFLAIAVALWTPLLVGIASAAGAAAFDQVGSLRAGLVLAVLLALLLLVVVRRLVLPIFSWRGRRELVGTWRRLTRWEFWPPWLFYPPVLLYAAWLGLRHRGLTVFTAANPGFPAGGFIGESKADILDAVDRAIERIAPPVMRVPEWRRVDPGPLESRALSVRNFVDQPGVGFPVVLKPDVGQRGQGVESVLDSAAAESWLDRQPGRSIAQRYAAGREFGLFYYRKPGEPSGRIFSITEKNPPVVVGDGRSTLEELVLTDPRAVAIAGVYRRELGARRETVPAAGERVPLIDIGTHARGSIFLDGTRHLTPALEAAVDEVSRSIDGFYFGRYDVRVRSVEDLEAARDLQVLELNGVTAESTDIYDPGNSVVDAWRKLMRQWRLAYEIGAANRALGARVTTVGELLRLMWDNRKQLPR